MSEERREEIPIALVTLRGSEAEGWLWVVECCPHCGKTHVHGGGRGDGDPRRFLTHRVAHCWEGEGGGYDLVEDTVILTCAFCGVEFEQVRWQFEVDVEEEGENYEPYCPTCSGLEET